MLTRFNDKYIFDREFNGVIAQNIKYDGKDTKIKVYIPTLMPNIMHGGSGYRDISINRSKLFANSSNTMPATNNKITEKNYLYAKLDINSNIENISKIKINTYVKEYKCNLNIYSTDYIVDPRTNSYKESVTLTTNDNSYDYITDGNNNYEDDDDITQDSFYDESLSNPLKENDIEELNNIIFSTNNDDGSSFIILPADSSIPDNTQLKVTTTRDEVTGKVTVHFSVEGEDEIYDSSVLNGTRLSIYDTNDSLLYRSSNLVKGMYYEEIEEEKEYTIKENENVRCRFLNNKSSKLYINTNNT